jgi:hypothetical protein
MLNGSEATAKTGFESAQRAQAGGTGGRARFYGAQRARIPQGSLPKVTDA